MLYAVSGLLSALPRTFGEFLAARFLSGLGIGASSMICPIYVAELAPAARRGRLGTVFQLGIVVGIFLTLFVNAWIQGLGDAAWNRARGWRWRLCAEVAPASVFAKAFSDRASAVFCCSFGEPFRVRFPVASAQAEGLSFATNLAVIGAFAADARCFGGTGCSWPCATWLVDGWGRA